MRYYCAAGVQPAATAGRYERQQSGLDTVATGLESALREFQVNNGIPGRSRTSFRDSLVACHKGKGVCLISSEHTNAGTNRFSKAWRCRALEKPLRRGVGF